MPLDPNKFTAKAHEALQASQLLARTRRHEQVTAEHLLFSLLEQDDGLTEALFELLGVDPAAARARVESSMAWLPQATAVTTREVAMATDTYRLLDAADKERQKLGDDYVSTEHVLLAMAGLRSGVGEVLRGLDVTLDGLLEALGSVRGARPGVSSPPVAAEPAPAPAVEPAPAPAVESAPVPAAESAPAPAAESVPAPAGGTDLPPATRVPSAIHTVTADEVAKLVRLEEALHGQVVGQDDAATVVAGALRRSRAGLNDADRPVGAFLFAGPPGVGKTKLATALSEALLDGALVHFDMSEFSDRGSAAQLVGARSMQEAGELTEAVLRTPNSVVLLNDVDKAHPEVAKVVLRIIIDGGVVDGLGRAVDFTHSVVICTTGLGDGTDVGKTAAALRRYFKPEFLSALDEVVIFRALGEDDLGRIVDIELVSLGDRLAGRGLAIALTPPARAYLARAGADPAMGAHALKQLIRREVADRVALGLLQDEFVAGDTIEVDGSATGIVLRKQAPVKVR